MTLGQKLRKLRIDKNLAQKDLADVLHVTFQTVSKWERDENEPDLATLKTIANFYNVTLDYLVDENTEAKEKEEANKEETANSESQQKAQTVIINNYSAHICKKCGKEIPVEEVATRDVYKRVRVGRGYSSVKSGEEYYHKDCLSEIVKNEARAQQIAKQAKARKSRKICWGWSIAGGVIALIASLLVFLLVPYFQNHLNVGTSILFSALITYGIFAMIYCILAGSYIGDVFEWCLSRTIRFPGLIFSFDLDGFAWLIGMKILFAILGFLFGVAMLIFGIVFSASLGTVSFPFVLISSVNHNYEDALF